MNISRRLFRRTAPAARQTMGGGHAGQGAA
ncbi:hypothetical protein QF035_001278 [Streptomyces umbrinus]|uniref:Uncharacterized protein n=1 Tax=Streptomyces umbrinus TaxID=67370 RepID=A0ABU0SLW9_9ACTN|nr:hypothetical protein [Streptomyces umbrinus]